MQGGIIFVGMSYVIFSLWIDKAGFANTKCFGAREVIQE